MTLDSTAAFITELFFILLDTSSSRGGALGLLSCLLMDLKNKLVYTCTCRLFKNTINCHGGGLYNELKYIAHNV